MNPVHTAHQAGQLFLWKYTHDKNYPGYHMAWSKAGQNFFEKFLLLLSSSDSGTYKTLNLDIPDANVLAVPNNKHSELTYYSKLIVELSNQIDWSFFLNENVAHMVVSQQTAIELNSKISNVKNQVELSFEEISFWW